MIPGFRIIPVRTSADLAAAISLFRADAQDRPPLRRRPCIRPAMGLAIRCGPCAWASRCVRAAEVASVGRDRVVSCHRVAPARRPNCDDRIVSPVCGFAGHRARAHVRPAANCGAGAMRRTRCRLRLPASGRVLARVRRPHHFKRNRGWDQADDARWIDDGFRPDGLDDGRHGCRWRSRHRGSRARALRAREIHSKLGDASIRYEFGVTGFTTDRRAKRISIRNDGGFRPPIRSHGRHRPTRSGRICFISLP